MPSIRGRLLGWLLGLFTLVGAIAGYVAYALDSDEVADALDAQLRQIAVNVGDIATPNPGVVADGHGIDPEDVFVVTVWSADGRPHSSDSSIILPRQQVTGFVDFFAAGENWRGFALVQPSRVVEVAQRTVVRDEFATDSALRAVLPVAILLPLSWLVIGWAVPRALRPLHLITEALRNWDEAKTRPLPLSGVPAEVMPLVVATNDLISRLDAQIAFRERFISDAAHELRTPLTALRLQLGNLRDPSPGSSDPTDAMKAGLRRMSGMIDQMLKLARVESDVAKQRPGPVSLDAVVLATIQQLLPRAQQKRIDLGVTNLVSATVFAEPNEVRALVENLLDNAIRYTPPGGVVDVEVTSFDDHATLEIRDTGPGIPDPLLPRVFERFFRGANTDGEGSGLGLAIARAVVEKGGGTISLANRSGGTGLVARVVFAGSLGEPG